MHQARNPSALLTIIEGTDRTQVYDPRSHVPSLHFEEITMKRFFGVVIFGLLLTPALLAQENYSEGPVWNVSLIRVKPTHMDDYLASLRQVSKPFFDEEKRQGMIMDYKIFLKETKNSPEDWDICLAIQYKNHAALDGLTAKFEAVRDKIMGGKQPAHQLAEKRQEIREVVSDQLLQEIILK